MKLKLKVHPGSSIEKIQKVDEGYEIWIKAKAKDNKANLELIKILKKYFKKDVKITSGFNSRNKIIEIGIV